MPARCRVPFLPQPSEFTLTWDSLQLCWTAYHVAWLHLEGSSILHIQVRIKRIPWTQLLIYTSVRPIRKFRDIPITNINARTHPITDTDMKVSVYFLCCTPSHLPPPRYSSTVSELAGRIGVRATRLYTWIKRPSVYAATDQKVEAGWGDADREHSVKLLS